MRSRKTPILEHGGPLCNLYMLKEVMDVLDEKKKNGAGPREIRVWMFVWRLNILDAMKNIFEVDFVVYAQWEESVSNLKVHESERGPWKRPNFGWLPELTFPHMVEKPEGYAVDVFSVREDAEADWITKEVYRSWKPVLSEKDTVVVQQTLRRRGRIHPPCPCYKHFPFDWHLLTICVSSNRSHREVLLRFHNSFETTMSGQVGQTLKQQFAVHDPILMAYNSFSETLGQQVHLPLLSFPDWSHTKNMHSRMYLAPLILRRWHPYALKMFLPLFLLTGASFGAFLMDFQEAGPRLTFLAVLLACVFLHSQALAKQLPDFDFFTWVDVYHYLSLGHLLLTGFAVGTPSMLLRRDLYNSATQYSEEEEYTHLKLIHSIDQESFWGLITLWACAQLIFVLAVARQLLQRRQLIQLTKKRQRRLSELSRRRGGSLSEITHKELSDVKKRYSMFSQSDEVKEESSYLSQSTHSGRRGQSYRAKHKGNRIVVGEVNKPAPQLSIQHRHSLHSPVNSSTKVKSFETTATEERSQSSITVHRYKDGHKRYHSDILDRRQASISNSPVKGSESDASDLNRESSITLPHVKGGYTSDESTTSQNVRSLVKLAPQAHQKVSEDGSPQPVAQKPLLKSISQPPSLSKHPHTQSYDVEMDPRMRFILSPGRLKTEKKILKEVNDTVETVANQQRIADLANLDQAASDNSKDIS